MSLCLAFSPPRWLSSVWCLFWSVTLCSSNHAYWVHSYSPAWRCLGLAHHKNTEVSFFTLYLHDHVVILNPVIRNQSSSIRPCFIPQINSDQKSIAYAILFSTSIAGMSSGTFRTSSFSSKNTYFLPAPPSFLHYLVSPKSQIFMMLVVQFS